MPQGWTIILEGEDWENLINTWKIFKFSSENEKYRHKFCYLHVLTKRLGSKNLFKPQTAHSVPLRKKYNAPSLKASYKQTFIFLLPFYILSTNLIKVGFGVE